MPEAEEMIAPGLLGEEKPGEENQSVMPADARRRVRDALRRPSVRTNEERLENAVLVTSELVTNAIRHGGGLTGFSVTVLDDSCEVTVADRSTRLPSARASRCDIHPGGFGWPIVHRLANAVAVTVTSTGKTIRVILPLR
ncbi:ATP-binding protein [Streptomyces sp. NBC_00370]|uniref:ATP-binding protein n=1 Tax=Streptomyces sp. NBC_00370 TaxID=2975728 RepID=UPI002E268BDD